MNRKIIGILITLVIISMGLFTAAPVSAADFHVYPGEVEGIQDAIDNAADGDVIYVHEGIYSENILIDGVDLTLIAVGNVTIDGSTNIYANKTIAIYNSTCTIDGFNVEHNGCAIYARGMSSLGEGAVNVTIINNYVTNYIKNGITVNGELATGTIRNNTVVSIDDPIYAQNGIQFGYGATGEAHRNNVDTNWYLGEDWTACGILIFEADDVSVKQNEVSDAQTGIGIETWGWFCPTASYNQIANNTIDNSEWGVTVTAYSWTYSGMDCFANNNKVVNNTITADEGVGSIGVYIGAAYISGDYTPATDNNKVINNKISGFEEPVEEEGTATKVHANRIPYE